MTRYIFSLQDQRSRNSLPLKGNMNKTRSARYQSRISHGSSSFRGLVEELARKDEQDEM